MAKVLVGMSGGVDSAVAAYLLKEAGHDVIGVTLRTWPAKDGRESRCCEIDDARRVAWKLRIPYYPLNSVADFQERVAGPFIKEYIRGWTPNPCIECNRYVKWERMLYAARAMQADYIATGHYASVVRLANGRFSVKRALHSEKDQTYMLYALTQEQLAATLMPLGNLSKEEVRKIAERAELPVARKPDSQDICFISDGNYADYIEKNAASVPGEGRFIDEEGKVLGKHKGIIHYTVGQRKGLGLALGYPAYVKRIRAESNEIVIGNKESLCSTSLICDDIHFMGIPALDEGERLPCAVKVRYRHDARDAVIEKAGSGRVKVVFKSPVRAVAPGQSAVFYDGNGCVIGGGKISDNV